MNKFGRNQQGLSRENNRYILVESGIIQLEVFHPIKKHEGHLKSYWKDPRSQILPVGTIVEMNIMPENHHANISQHSVTINDLIDYKLITHTKITIQDFFAFCYSKVHITKYKKNHKDVI